MDSYLGVKGEMTSFLWICYVTFHYLIIGNEAVYRTSVWIPIG